MTVMQTYGVPGSNLEQVTKDVLLGFNKLRTHTERWREVDLDELDFGTEGKDILSLIWGTREVGLRMLDVLPDAADAYGFAVHTTLKADDLNQTWKRYLRAHR